MESPQKLRRVRVMIAGMHFTMFRVFSALALVCGVCVCARAERQDLPRDFGVKLCGREFIRAVIFTCGGSRWRRSALPLSLWPLSSSPDPLEPRLARRSRSSFSLGLAGMCCNHGCTKNDIGRLC